jgi:NADH dehydrogenase
MIVVTGGNGYVAAYTIQQLRKTTDEPVKALVRGEEQFDKVRALGAVPAKGDVTDPPSLEAAFKGATRVIHLAAVNRDRGKSTMRAVNAQGTLNVVDAARHAGARQLVTVVGLGADPNKPYPLAQTQGVGVKYLERSGLCYTVLEASVVFGPGDEFINTLAGLARLPPFMIVPGDGKTKFQPIAVQDVASCVTRSLDNPDATNKRLQICGEQVLTLEQIIDMILAELKLRRIKLHMPVPILRIAVGAMDRLLPKSPVTPSLLAQLGADNVAVDNATEAVFGVKPICMADGIGYVHDMRLSTLVRRSLGKVNYH